MKAVPKRILTIIYLIFFIKNYGQNSTHEYCYNSTDKDGVKTQLKFEIFADSTYNWKSQILSSPKFGKIKKIDGSEFGRIIKKDNKLFLRLNNENNSNSEFQIKLTKQKLVILGYKRKKKFLSNKYDYILSSGIIFKNNKCNKTE